MRKAVSMQWGRQSAPSRDGSTFLGKGLPSSKWPATAEWSSCERREPRRIAWMRSEVLVVSSSCLFACAVRSESKRASHLHSASRNVFTSLCSSASSSLRNSTSTLEAASTVIEEPLNGRVPAQRARGARG